METLSGKTAFITGSSRGIGQATALTLARNGVRVILHGTKESPALLETVKACGKQACFVTADFTQSSPVRAMCQDLLEKKQIPDILILNASTQSYTSLTNFDSGEFDRMYRANVESSYIILQELLPEMRKKKWGRILFNGSINGVKAASRLAVYGSTKAALLNLAKTAALENAPYNITVNTILPGVIETDRNAAVLQDQAFADSLKEKIPMHRFGSAQECADLFVFLASGKASYITGAEIPIAGGLQI